MISSTLDSGAHYEADGGYLIDRSGTKRGGAAERRMDGGDVLRRARSTPKGHGLASKRVAAGAVFFCEAESSNSEASAGL